MRGPAAAVIAFLSACPVVAAEWVPSLDARLRHERVDDVALAREASATTLRIRPGLRLDVDAGWSAFAEVEATSHLSGEAFNSTANGRTGYPVVADPDNSELNQLWVQHRTPAPGTWTVGRQRLVLANQRFFGNVGWRQNEQTFDALDWQGVFGRATLRYDWLDRVQRIAGADHPAPAQARWALDAHLLHASWQRGPLSLTGYGHWIDNDTLPATSHRNLGLRASWTAGEGAAFPWSVSTEAAVQRPYAGGAAGNEARYRLLEGEAGWAGSTWFAGHEVLGGDGVYGFSTPFATLHAFNGWADRFTATPADGLRDTWVGWKRGFGTVQAQVALHAFRADRHSADYGRELDASLRWSIAPRWSLLAKLARYRADGFGSDVTKAWLDVEFRY